MSYPDASATMDGAKRAHVLFLHPSNELYGADTSLLYLLRGLDRTRFQPLVILANDLSYEGALSRELTASGIETRSLPIAVARRKYLSPSGLPGFLARIQSSTRMVSRIIEEEHIDLVHTNTLAVWTGALAARRTGCPHVWHIREQLERPRPLRALMQRFVPAYSTRVAGVSQAALYTILTSPSARAKGTVIYNGVDPHIWRSPPGREQVRMELGCASDEVLIGMVARISHMKAPDLFIRAISPLLARYPKLHGCIVGGPVPGQADVIDHVRELIAASPAPERIHLLGERRDVPALMAGMDILAAPSRYGEGASLTIIQGMFAGKPIVASNLGGNQELVVHGETGVIVPVDDPVALSTALDELVADSVRREAMGQAGQRLAAERFSVDRTIREFNEFLWAIYSGSATAAQRVETPAHVRA